MSGHEFHCNVWCKTKEYTDGSIVYFGGRLPFKVSIFDNKDDAEEMYDLFRGEHPNIARVYPVFQVDGDPHKFVLPFELLGVCLDTIIEKNKFIHDDERISEFYRLLLVSLFEVLKYININLEEKIVWEAKLTNIYVFETCGKPIFKLVGFKKRVLGATNLGKQCHELCQEVIDQINTRCNWATSYEMAHLCRALMSGASWQLRSIAHNPIFLSLVQRKFVLTDVGDFTKNGGPMVDEYPGKEKISSYFFGWKLKVGQHEDLRELKEECDHVYPEPEIQLEEHDEDPCEGLYMFHQAVADHIKTQLFPTVDHIMYKFEHVFKGVLYEIAKFGRELEDHEIAGTLVPKKNALEKLFITPNI